MGSLVEKIWVEVTGNEAQEVLIQAFGVVPEIPLQRIAALPPVAA